MRSASGHRKTWLLATTGASLLLSCLAATASFADSTVPEGWPQAVCPSAPPPAPANAFRPSRNALRYRPFPATWQSTLDSFTRSGKVPGAVIIVKSPDWGVRVGTTGFADLVTKQPIGPDQQFRVGSVTKAFMGQLILRLEQQGKLRLNDPVLTYLGDDKIVAGIPNISKITIAELLQMRSGITNYLSSNSIRFSPQVAPDKAFTPDDLLSVVSIGARPGANAPELQPDYAPGDTYTNPYWATVLNKEPPAPPTPVYPAWQYSNSNYTLLGMIAEKVSGIPIAELLKREVFDVAGLRDTYFATGTSNLPTMHGYTKFGAIPYPTQVYGTWCDTTAINPSYAWTAGAIVSTPWDLLRFEDAMFQSDQLLNDGTKAKWFTFVSADIHVGWGPMQYGLGGLMQPERSYGMARGHGGSFPGYKTLLYYFPDQKIAFVLASNTFDEDYEAQMLDSIMPEVGSAVSTPTPRNAVTHVRVGPDGKVKLGWQAGRVYGKVYTVYWSTDAAKVDRATAEDHGGVTTKTVLEVSAEVTVPRQSTVFWRVDTVVPDQTMPLVMGPTWEFHTD
jgi:D-alanyl-D-alanine carboxypeptidase